MGVDRNHKIPVAPPDDPIYKRGVIVGQTRRGSKPPPQNKDRRRCPGNA